MTVIKPGDRVHGFAGGYFGRDSYTCRTVEYIGPDYVVLRSDNEAPMLASTRNAELALSKYGERKADYDGQWCCTEDDEATAKRLSRKCARGCVCE